MSIYILAIFSYYLPLEKDGTHHLDRFDSLVPKDHLCQVWLKLALWFWRRRWKCEIFTTTTIRSEIFLNWTRSNKQSVNEFTISYTNILILFPLQLMYTIFFFLHSFKTRMLIVHVYFIRFVWWATSGH